MKMTSTWAGAPQNWPDLNKDNEYYVDIILYAKKPIYFIGRNAVVTANSTACPGAGVVFDMYSNKQAGAAFVYTISRTIGGTPTYSVTVRQVTSTTIVKPEDIIRGSNSPLINAMLCRFTTSAALGDFLYQSCVGYFVCFVTRQGSMFLRAPRWSGDYNYNAIADVSTQYDPRCNAWGGSTGTYVEATQPFIPKPIEGVPDIWDANFRTITNVLDVMQGISVSDNELSSSGMSTIYRVLQFNNDQTPWLNNPTVWSTDV